MKKPPGSLDEVFADLRKTIAELTPDSDGDYEKLRFQTSSFVEIPHELVCSEIVVVKRQFYRRSGLSDSVRILLSRSSSTNLGLWLVACCLQKTHAEYALKLTNPESEVQRIVVRFETWRDTLGVRPEVCSFYWEPGDSSNIGYGKPSDAYLSQTSALCLVDSSGDFMVDFDRRNDLELLGEVGGGCLLGAFFLDFGLSSCDLNYGYVSDAGSYRYCSNLSCECRVEMSDAFSSGVMFRKIAKH